MERRKTASVAATLLTAVFWQAALAQTTRPGMPEDVVQRLTDPAAPDAANVQQLLADLKAQPLVREAALRRLLAHPSVAARPAVEAFANETLAARTAILDLLRAWHAPIDGIDPWQTDSLTPDRAAALKAWAAKATDPPPATQGTHLLPDELAHARADIDRLLLASSPAEAQIIRERLARYRQALLPEVYARLQNNPTDDAHRRLIELRYRLVASDRLALVWPDGLEQLASGQPRQRIAALDELAGKATHEDERLLLELFSDPDPFVRERSLQLLKNVGGDQMTASMARLLADPEPNVRAAVLKQLLEAPPPEIADEVIAYSRREKDADLLVLAARVLRAIKGQEAVDALSDLLRSESWRVRAEAIDGMKESAENLDAIGKATTYAKIVKLLDDPDGFVIARAVEALKDAKLVTALDPMMRAAQHHPEAADDVVGAMVSDENLAAGAVGQLQTLCGDADPRVRAAAIGGLVAAAPRTCMPRIETGLKDADPRVRMAAVTAAFDAMCRLRTGARGGGGGHRGEVWFTAGNAQETLDTFRADASRQPPHLDLVLAIIKPMLATAPTPADRAAVASALIAGGRLVDKALPQLESIAEKDANQRDKLVLVLPWLPWDVRLASFGKLVSWKPDTETLNLAVRAVAEPMDPHPREALWGLLADADSLDLLDAVHTGLCISYFGNRYYDVRQMAEELKTLIVAELLAKAAAGSEFQRTVALALLLNASPEDCIRAAQAILDDPKSGEWARIDAFQIQLLAQPQDKGDQDAAKRVADPVLGKVAVPYLALHDSELRELRGRVYLYFVGQPLPQVPGGQPLDVSPPAGMPTEPLLAMMKGSDERLAAMAGYLLALTKNREGYVKLEAYWRSHEHDDQGWRRLVWRAISALNDDSLTPVLEEIYHAMGPGDWYVKEFYWTIRGIKGEKILKLRKQIRDEVGMPRLQ